MLHEVADEHLSNNQFFLNCGRLYKKVVKTDLLQLIIDLRVPDWSVFLIDLIIDGEKVRLNLDLRLNEHLGTSIKNV